MIYSTNMSSKKPRAPKVSVVIPVTTASIAPVSTIAPTSVIAPVSAITPAQVLTLIDPTLIPSKKAKKPEKTEEELKNTKQYIYDSLGLRIPQARVRTKADDLGINKLIDDSIKPIKEKMSAVDKAKALLEKGKKIVKGTDPKDPKDVKEVELTASEIAEFQAVIRDAHDYEKWKAAKVTLLRERIRFNSESCLALAFICDFFIEDLVVFAKSKMKDTQSKKFCIDLFMQKGISDVRTYALFKDLPSFVENREAFEKEQRGQSLNIELDAKLREINKKNKEIKHAYDKLAKKYNKLAKKDEEKPFAEEKAAIISDIIPIVSATTEALENELDGRHSFKTYVKNIYKAVFGPDSKIRVDKAVLEMLSNMVSEFITKVVSGVSCILDIKKAKTITESIIIDVVEIMLVGYNSHKHELRKEEIEETDPESLKVEREKKAQNIFDRRAAQLAGHTPPDKYIPDNSKSKKIKVVYVKKYVVYDNQEINKFKASVLEKLKACEGLLDQFNIKRKLEVEKLEAEKLEASKLAK